VEWIVNHLPAEGTAWEFATWTQAERDRLVDDFVASPFGRRCTLRADRVRSLAEHFVWHGCDYGSGDPLRWSPIVIELVLANWFPRKIHGLTQADIDAVPGFSNSSCRSLTIDAGRTPRRHARRCHRLWSGRMTSSRRCRISSREW
jgi:hypothetical protein